MVKKNEHMPLSGEMLLYETVDGNARVECRFIDESLWLSQSLIAELFGVSVKTANEHLKNIYDSDELPPEATIRKFRIVQMEGPRQVSHNIEHYKLDRFLAFNDRDVLAGAGTISHKAAIIHAAACWKPTVSVLQSRHWKLPQNRLRGLKGAKK